MGKSNVLDAFRFVADAMRDGLTPALQKRGGRGALSRQGGESGFRVSIEFDHGGERWFWGVLISELHVSGPPSGTEWAFSLPHALVPELEAHLLRLKAEVNGAGISRDRSTLLYTCLFDAPTGLLRRRFVTSTTRILNAGRERTDGPLRALTLPIKAQEDPAWAPLFDALSGFGVYSLFPPALREPQRQSSTSIMADHGENWTSVLRRIQPEYGADLLAGLGRFVPDLFDYRVEVAGDHLVASFEHRPERGAPYWSPASRESDGTLRAAALLTAVLQDPAPSVIGIEEPELAVHLWAMPVLQDFILHRAERTPVILSTHSRELLDLVPVESILVVERDDRGTRVSPISTRQTELVRRKVSTVGELLWSENLQSEPVDG